jgi:ABC-type glycerol-3-phosphate transport system substrate-binding protein
LTEQQDKARSEGAGPSRSRARTRNWLLVSAAGVLAALVAIDLAGRGGPLRAAYTYVGGLLHRAGPTRDLLRGARRAAGGREARPTTLRVWDWWSPSTTEDYARYFGEIEQTFESQHPNVDVVFQAVPFGNYEQKLATGMLGEHPPDVFQCSVIWAQGLYRRGMLRELNDLVAKTPELQDDQFMPSTLYHSRDAGKIYGIPHIVDSSCLLWNLDMIRAEESLHDMFERRGDGSIDFGRIRFEAVRDWAHFRAIARRLTKRRAPSDKASPGDGELTQAGFELNAYEMGAGMFLPWAASNGVSFQDRAGTRALFDTPAGAGTLAFLVDLYWTDRACPPFRRELTSYGRFQEGRVACTMGGTWSGKYLVRNTQGWMGFGLTAFPPGPHGSGCKTTTWANMMVMSSTCRVPEVAWEFIRYICGLEGSLLKLRHLQQNSPRLDFYRGDAWAAAVRERPYLANVPRICASGDPHYHTQTQAVQDETQPIFEYVLLNWPDIEAGKARFADTAEAVHLAAQRVNAVYRRHAQVVRGWSAQDRRPRGQGSN